MSHAYPCSYEWDTTRFPDPAGFVKNLNDKHIKTNVWINPYISPATELYEKMEPYTALILSGVVSYLITPCLRHNKSLIIISRKINWI